MGRTLGGLVLGLLALAGPGQAAGPDLLGGGRLVTYTPYGWDPRTGRVPGPASLRIDAGELHRRGFRAVATPGSTGALRAICRIFKRRGFRTVLVGVADPGSRRELGSAIAQRRCADGYVVGDGGLASGRYTRAVLAAAVRRIRTRTGRPVTVQEQLGTYDDDPSLLGLGDWIYPTADPYAAAAWHSADACGYTITHRLALMGKVPAEVPVVLAGTGLPTAGDPKANEHYQRAFFFCLETRRVLFAYDEAFDQPWRTGPAAHRGLFRDDGTPKMLAAALAVPGITVTRHGAWLRGRVRNVARERFRVVVFAHAATWSPRAASTIGRRGKWKARVPEAAEAGALLVARSFVAEGGLEQPPQVDGARVFAAAGADGP